MRLEAPTERVQAKGCGACGEGEPCAACSAPSLVRPPGRVQRWERRASSDPAERQADEIGARIGDDLATIGPIGGGGLPDPARRAAERHLGVSLLGTTLSAGSQSHERATDEGALAVTEGATVHFRRGFLDTSTRERRALLGHELVHVAQQRSSGASAKQLFRWPWEPTPTNDQLIREGVGGDTGSIVEITDFSAATEAQRLLMIDHLTSQIWVGSGSAAALTRIWTSFGGDFARVAGENPLRWRNTAARYPGIWDAVPEAQRVRGALPSDVRAIAQRNLETNRAYADEEMERLGLPRRVDEPAAPPTEAQAGRSLACRWRPKGWPSCSARRRSRGRRSSASGQSFANRSTIPPHTSVCPSIPPRRPP